MRVHELNLAASRSASRLGQSVPFGRFCNSRIRSAEMCPPTRRERIARKSQKKVKSSEESPSIARPPVTRFMFGLVTESSSR